MPTLSLSTGRQLFTTASVVEGWARRLPPKWRLPSLPFERHRARAANEQKARRHLLKRFPYVLHYVIEQEPAPGGAESVVIYAVRHSRRDQAYWLHRLPPASGNP